MAEKQDLYDAEIREWSFVGDPAHEDAKAVIMKRRDGPPATPATPTSKAAPKRPVSKMMATVLTSIVDGHQHGIEIEKNGYCWVSYATAEGDEKDHTHPIVKNADMSYELGMSDGHTHTIDQTALAQALLALMTKRSDPVAPTNDDLQAKLDAMTKERDTAVKARDEATKRAERAENVVGLQDEHREHFDDLDTGAQDEFLAKSASDRDAEIEVRKAADPVEYTTTDGLEIRKSAGVAVITAIRKSDEVAKQNEVLKAERAQTALEKRAGENLAHLPGELATHAEILRQLDAIEDETVRKAAHEAVKAGSSAMQTVFKANGHMATAMPESAQGKLDALVKSYAKEHNVTEAQATNKVLETPEGAALYDEADAQAQPAA